MKKVRGGWRRRREVEAMEGHLKSYADGVQKSFSSQNLDLFERELDQGRTGSGAAIPGNGRDLEVPQRFG
jgi:hypothetical protein